MIHTGHRLSKDIDAFIDDPQYISVLSPRLGGEGTWACDAYDEAGNYLKLTYPEGEIDFIVAAPITDIPVERKTVDMGDDKPGISHMVMVEHAVEIAIKKLNYRGSMLKVRDIFDIAVVDSIFSDLLHDQLPHVAHLKLAITKRLSGISEEFCRQALEELAIADKWRPLASTCLERVRSPHVFRRSRAPPDLRQGRGWRMLSYTGRAGSGRRCSGGRAGSSPRSPARKTDRCFGPRARKSGPSRSRCPGRRCSVRRGNSRIDSRGRGCRRRRAPPAGTPAAHDWRTCPR